LKGEYHTRSVLLGSQTLPVYYTVRLHRNT